MTNKVKSASYYRGSMQIQYLTNKQTYKLKNCLIIYYRKQIAVAAFQILISTDYFEARSQLVW